MRRLTAHDISRLLLLPVLLLCGALTTHAQNDIQMTQYWAVPTYYNPAAAGSSGMADYLRIRGGASLQWLGIKNAPVGFLGSADMPVKIGKQRIGVGALFMQETLGLFTNMEISVQAGYKLRLLGGELSIGVQGGYFTQKFKGTEVEIPDGDDFHDPSDEAIPTQDLTGNSFDLSAGLLYTHRYFHFGISGQHLLEPTIRMSLEGSETTETQEYETTLGRAVYFIGGGNIPIKNTLFELQPSFLVRTDFRTFSAEITARGVYNRFLSFGLGYRWKEAVSVMIGAEFKNFFLGYSYDYPTSAIVRASSGSHGIVAGYQLKLNFSGKNRNKHRSIRFM